MSKPKKQNQALPSSHENLSDVEFIANADYLSSPYYRSYLEARNRSTVMSNRCTYDETNTAVAGGLYGVGETVYKRRKGFLAIIAIFMLVILAVAALGYIGTIVPEYVSAFTKPGEEIAHISVTDPVLGALKEFAKMDMISQFHDDFTAVMANETETKITTKIVFYGMPIAIALILLLALIVLIVAIVAIAKRSVSKGYVAKKCKLGFLLLLMFLLSLFVAAAAIIWNGAPFSEAIDFFTGKSLNVYAGYGLFALVGASLLGFICNLLAYKKVRR